MTIAYCWGSDCRNQMIEYIEYVDEEPETRHVYRYDALGRRISKTVDADAPNPSTRTTWYTWNGWRLTRQEYLAYQSVMVDHFFYGNGIDEVIIKQDYYALTNPYHVFFRDDQGSVVAVTDTAGVLLERYEYDDYGRPTIFDPDDTELTESAIGNDLLYTGRQYDAETGLYYYRTRYLDPAAGRFTTRDTIGVWGDPMNLGNAYTYVGNNPWTLVDPMGLGDRYEMRYRGFPSPTIGPEQRPVNVRAFYDRAAGRTRSGVEAAAWARAYEGQQGIANAWLDHQYLEEVVFGKILDEITPWIPFVNDARDWAGFYEGVDPLTQEELGWSGRGMYAVGMVAGSGAGFKKIKEACEKRLGALYDRLRRGRGGRGGGPSKPVLPPEAWHKDAPRQVTPGTKSIEHTKYNPKTGNWERSTVEYDDYGRQIRRTDYTDHGYPNDHTVPHTHEIEYNARYPNGREKP